MHVFRWVWLLQANKANEIIKKEILVVTGLIHRVVQPVKFFLKLKKVVVHAAVVCVRRTISDKILKIEPAA